MAGARVDTADLRAVASFRQQAFWYSVDVAVMPPDGLRLAVDAAANLNENARALREYQKWATVENQRIAEMLNIAAAAYDDVDRTYKDKFDDPGRASAVDAIPIPAPSTPLPPIPAGPAPMKPLGASDYSDVEQTQQLLAAGDHGASAQAAAVEFGLAADSAAGHALPPTIGSWEGDAADAAYARSNSFSGWLHELSAAWLQLAQAAEKLYGAHTAALAEHTNIYVRYESLKAQLMQLMGQPGTGPQMQNIQRKMEQLQHQSEAVRENYAGNATFAPVRPSPPPAGSPSGPTTVAARSGGSPADGEDRQQPAGQQPGPQAALAQGMERSLGQPQSGGVPSGGAPSGGAPSGGTPSGVGAPAGGVSGGGPQKGLPKLPTDPSLRPAAASGGGGAGAGNGGGLPSAPLSAAVNAETVAPGPTVPTPTATVAAAAGPGAGAGAMGGMPMGHGGGHNQGGKEKRRTPDLSPDEDIYSEDRPWTEAVIGNRRRKDVQDGRESK